MILRNFIVFEGIDGAGTSTQIEQLKKRARANDFFFTAEPTDGEIGKFLRRMLRGDMQIESSTAAYLFAADRNEHLYGTLLAQGQQLTSGITQVCAAGRRVVSDRYLFSSLAYQGISCPGDLPYLLNSSFPLPQLLFYFDIDPARSLERIEGRRTKEIFEEESFLRRAAEGYKTAIARISKAEREMKVVTLDAMADIKDLADIIWKEIAGTCG